MLSGSEYDARSFDDHSEVVFVVCNKPEVPEQPAKRECPFLKPSVLFYGLANFLSAVPLPIPQVIATSFVWTMVHRLFTHDTTDGRWFLRTFGAYLGAAVSGYGLRALIDAYGDTHKNMVLAALLCTSGYMMYAGCKEEDEADEQDACDLCSYTNQ